jgi:four helix bundle protein
MSNSVAGFEDLVAWPKARLLVRQIYELVETPPFKYKFAFCDQLERAAVSVMSNIAEGYERGSRAEFHHMLSIAKGSCAEVRSLLFVASDVGFISPITFETLNNQAIEVSRVVGGLRASVGRQRDADRTKPHS